jgi:hypothetical protein
MLIAFNLGPYRISFGIVKVEKVIGITSLTKDEKHILMWDFDDISLKEVVKALREVQNRYKLPNIFVLQTSENSYIAYCFKKFEFEKAWKIVAETRYVDPHFLGMSYKRAKFTLRIGPKVKKPIPRLVCVIESPHPQDSHLGELKAFVRYQTRWGC